MHPLVVFLISCPLERVQRFGAQRLGVGCSLAAIVNQKAADAPQSRDRTLMVLAISVTVYAAYLPVALWLGHAYVPVEMPRGQIVEPITNIKHIEGFGYQARTGRLIEYADNDPNNQRSPIVLYENLTPLGPAHSAHSDIQEIGRGRYSHWNDNPKSEWRSIRGVLLSASDNTDPRTNGRHYWAVLPR
jgi:hypothetical protein